MATARAVHESENPDGLCFYFEQMIPLYPVFQYSITPVLQYSIAPLLQKGVEHIWLIERPLSVGQSKPGSLGPGFSFYARSK